MHPIRLVVADDNPIFIRTLALFLSDYEDLQVVGTALGAKQALELIEKLRPEVLLLDLAMPALNGLEALPLLRILAPEMRVIIVTLHDPSMYQELALALGAAAYVHKDDVSQRLVQVIREQAWPIPADQVCC